ncbi:3-oxoacyl-[acyl-carrier protein] reductase [Friedmanniella endophytica]|uniref:3-oxoacyl-[acyl-carrier protein] reductase n=1 Tax=Microlunatus kandeliicorticis TaxID=1759536 RepID=A0A7W3IRC0_9ACTN|nr:SDR family NAD(P)-dependent oxidoreductase [Microlunatus kandeliicorticis]MBA8793807.1 3-oxoacyl-[acyl-carrier protein] reductase [Microlunatus kandeliicorticis]
MQLDLTDRVVVITGAGRGIGAGIAETFVAEGARVVGVDLAPPDLDGLAAGLAADVTDTAAVSALVQGITDRFGRVDVLINNAGVNAEALVEDYTDEEWDRCFAVNVGGVFKMCRAVVPIMKRQRAGRIINAASFAAIVPSITSAAYAATKSAVVQFTRVLAGELGPYDVTVNAYAPGMIPTAINHFTELPDDVQTRLLDTLTLRRWGSAGEVADLLVFLASDAARYITGTLVDVSGGKLATQVPKKAYELAGDLGSGDAR